MRTNSRTTALAAVLVVGVGALGACSSDDGEASAPTTTEASAPTTEKAEPTTTEASEPLVLEGTQTGQDEVIELPGGFSNSVALEGDVVGQGAFLGTATTDGPNFRIEGDWVFHLRSPDLGDGLIAVQEWEGLAAPTDFEGTGEVTGLSGAFADMTGTLTLTNTGTDPEEDGPGNYAPGSYVLELQPSAPSPDPAEPTEERTIEFETASVRAWFVDPAYGGGNTTSGDVVGTQGWTGTTTDRASYAIYVGTLDGVGEGVFITSSVFNSQGATFAAETEFFGISGAFAGLRGEGMETGATYDETGAFAPASSITFEVSG